MAVSRTVVAGVDRAATPDTVTLIMVHAPYGMGTAERTRLKEYVAVRLNLPAVALTINPPGFPWPSRR